MLTSVYMQYLSRGGTRSPEDFFTEENAPGYPRFRTGHFRYDWLIGSTATFFGRNVPVLTQEEMASDLAGFLGFPAFAEAPRQDAFRPGRRARARELPRGGGAAAAPDQPLPGRPGLAGVRRSGRVSAGLYRWAGAPRAIRAGPRLAAGAP